MIDRLIFALFCLYNGYKAYIFYGLQNYTATNTHLLIIILLWLVKFWNDYQHNNEKK